VFGYCAENRQIFPNPNSECLFQGVLAVSHTCSPEMLFEAYSFGIFPWPQQEGEVLWFCPDERGVLFFDKLHIPQRLRRSLKSKTWSFTVNQAFDQVIDECAKIPRKHESGTWITSELLDAYKAFHKMGYAHSVECWQEGRLVGGIYGVSVGGVFSGESMFFKETDASKACFLHLIEKLRENGVEWLDIQMVTPITESFGGESISRNDFLKLVAETQKKSISLTF